MLDKRWLKFCALAFVILSLVLLTTGCPAAPPANATPEQKKEAQERQIVDAIAIGLDTGATSIQTGIVTFRTLRVSGVVSPSDSLELAKIARDANSVVLEGAELALSFEGDMDASEGQKAVDKLDKLIESAQRLNARGTLHIKSDRSKVIFAVGSAASIAVLRSQRNNLQKLLRAPGLRLRIDGSQRERFESARDVARENERQLAEAVRELESLPAATTPAPNPSMVLLPQPSLNFRYKRLTATVTVRN